MLTIVKSNRNETGFLRNHLRLARSDLPVAFHTEGESYSRAGHTQPSTSNPRSRQRTLCMQPSNGAADARNLRCSSKHSCTK